MMTDFQFIDSNVKVWTGEEARQRLLEKNDSHFLQANKGVIEVTRERWIEAQSFERRTWMEISQAASDDRNHYHFEHFRGYKDVRGRYFRRAVELGCGPFTNARLIIPQLGGLAQIDLLDPLIDDYLSHPNCTYKSGSLGNLPTNLIKSSIEDWNTSLKYDLVIVINVLEHCFNVPAIFEKIAQVLVPGGVLIFADVSADEEFLMLDSCYDSGHPIRLVDDYLEDCLNKDYDVRSYYRFKSFELQDYKNNCHYFIGTRAFSPKFEDQENLMPLISLSDDMSADCKLRHLLSVLDSGIDHWRLRIEIAYAFMSGDLRYVIQGREMLKTVDQEMVAQFFNQDQDKRYNILHNILQV
jgi:SAM-dependent methyltransferase